MKKLLAAGLFAVALATGNNSFGNLEDRIFKAIETGILCTVAAKPTGPLSYEEISTALGVNIPFLVINKPSYKLHVISYDCLDQPCNWVYHDEYNISIGRNFGDKEREGDKKTPEGIYKIISIEEQFSGPAFRINYPNRGDRMEGKTGKDIFIHITSKRKIGKRVSGGCIGLVMEDIYDLKNYINIGTKVIIMPDYHR